MTLICELKKDDVITYLENNPTSNLNSNLIVSHALQKSPAIKALSLGGKNKNPNLYTKIKLL